MIKSMTGFGSSQADIAPFGKISVELRCSNHKFLEIVFHLPEGFLSLEDRIKKAIESKVKRGRVTCAVNITGGNATDIFINKQMLKNYTRAVKTIRGQCGIRDELSLDTLLHLPGVLSLEQNRVSKDGIWPHIKTLINRALDGLVASRQKEGRALYAHLKKRAQALNKDLEIIKTRFKKVLKVKTAGLATNEERANFLKDTDITEEIERLAFHIRNFKNKINKTGPVGKELDFIAQEMQREANTLAAKSCDAAISARIVQTKSQIEKIREQLQNIE